MAPVEAAPPSPGPNPVCRFMYSAAYSWAVAGLNPIPSTVPTAEYGIVTWYWFGRVAGSFGPFGVSILGGITFPFASGAPTWAPAFHGKLMITGSSAFGLDGSSG